MRGRGEVSCDRGSDDEALGLRGRIRRLWRFSPARAATTVAAGFAALGLSGAAASGASASIGAVKLGAFPRSSVVAEARSPLAPRTAAASPIAFPSAATAPLNLSAGANVDVILGQDVVQQATINGVSVKTCNPGIDTAQNETAIAVDPSNASSLVAGENDYRLYEPSEDRYDSSGGFDTSFDGGASWTAGFLPGLVQGNFAAPGPYQSAGDPSLSAGLAGTFWYGNIAFDRSDAANAVSASVSHDGGRTWTTSFPIQTSRGGGAFLFNDKAYIAADPANPEHAVVTWTQFHERPKIGVTNADIVFSQTTTGGRNWTKPITISTGELFSQGSIPIISGGKIYVVWEGTNPSASADAIVFAMSSDGGATFTAPRYLAVDSDIPESLPGWTPRINSFPTFAVDGTTLHVMWANWNGTNAHLAYVRSTDGGATWSAPVTLTKGAADDFFPWVGARGGTAYVTYSHRASGAGDVYAIDGLGSASGGAAWSGPAAVSSTSYNAGTGNEFGFPECAFDFIGDYSGLTVDSAGVAHSLWTGVTTGPGANQDPFTATLHISR